MLSFKSVHIRLTCLSLLTLIGLSSYSTTVYADQHREYALKSGFMINFARYTQGLHSPDADELMICSPDYNFINAARKTLKNVSVNGKKTTLHHLSEALTSIDRCHIVFISRDYNQRWRELLAGYQPKGQFVIGETDAFLPYLGHLRFYISSGKIRFEIHPKRLQQSGLKLSSKVMRLALITQKSNA